MGICSSCKKESPEGKRYCAECEERLRGRLSALETDLAMEEEEKRQKEKRQRQEEEMHRDGAHRREEESRASRRPADEEKPASDKTPGEGRDKGRSRSSDDSITSDIVTARVLAGVVDVSVALAGGMLLGRVMSFLGWVWVVAFLLLKDALFDGASPGKKVLGLVVRRARAGDLADTNNSVIRNISIAAGPLLMALGNLLSIDIPIIPDPFKMLGATLMLIGTILTVTALTLEFYWMRGDAAHRRFGDKIARTRVEWVDDSSDDPTPDLDEADEDIDRGSGEK